MAAVDTKSDVSHESALAGLFASVRAELPGGWLLALRTEALARLMRDGLPHRRVEAWKYTDFRNKLATGLAPARGLVGKPDGLFGGLGGHRVEVAGGKVVHLPKGGELADGVEIIGLADALAMPSLWLRQWLQPTESAVENMNLAFASDGALIRVGRGVTVREPVILRTSLNEGAFACTRNVVALEENAELTLIEIDDGNAEAQGFSNVVTAIALEPGARLRHLRVTASGGAALVVRTDNVEVTRDASYRGIQVSSGAALARQETRARLTGTGSECSLACAYAAGEGQHTDFSIVVGHEAPQTTSRILSKGVVRERGHAVVQGRVIVQPAAQKTDSHQLSRALLLSQHAEVDQKPELEIFADDVKCGHGAAVGALDPAQMFYLRARGIPEAEARRMLVGAFLAEVTDRLPDPYRAPVESWLSARMAGVAGGGE